MQVSRLFLLLAWRPSYITLSYHIAKSYCYITLSCKFRVSLLLAIASLLYCIDCYTMLLYNIVISHHHAWIRNLAVITY